MSRIPSRRVRLSAFAAGGALAAVTVLGAALPASAHEAPHHHGPQPVKAGFTIQRFAAVKGATSPDDIVRLGDSIFVAFSNGVGSTGTPATSGATASTVQQYSLNGKPGRTWTITGKIDGMGADAAAGRLLVTTNEDGNSSFHVIVPSSPRVTDYAYQGLVHGGGTDAVSVVDGTIVISASAPATASAPSSYAARLFGHTAYLKPLFADNATATAINGPQAGKPVTLSLTDPDSNTVVPSSVPKVGGSFLLDGQGDQQLVFARNLLGWRPKLSVLSVSQIMDDTAFATETSKTLWVADTATNTVDKITGSFADGQAVSSIAPATGKTYIGTTNLSTGVVTPIPGLSSVAPKGLLFTTGSGESEHRG